MRKVSYKIYTEDDRFYMDTTNYDLMKSHEEEGYRVHTVLTEVPEFSYWADSNGEMVCQSYKDRAVEKANGKELFFKVSNPLKTALEM